MAKEPKRGRDRERSQGKENDLVVQLEFHTWADSCGSYKYLFHELGSVSVKRAELPSTGLGLLKIAGWLAGRQAANSASVSTGFD